MVQQVRNNNGEPRLVTIFGGSGFIGRHVVGALAKLGYSIRVAVRRPDLAFHLQPLGNVGQIQAVQANLRFDWSVERAIEGSHIVINLAGILSETGRQKFDAVHCRGAATIAENCKKSGIALVHFSAIGADSDAPSQYCQTKGRGENLIHKICKSAIIMRPSIVFGSEDGFFNRFAAIAVQFPFLPLPGGGQTKFQPVYVGDVAKAVLMAVEGKLASGKIYELGGKDVLSFRQCMVLILEVTRRKNALVSIPWFIMRWMAILTGWLPGAPVTSDQVRTLQNDNIVSTAAVRQKRTLEGMGIDPTTLAAILPKYLARFRPNGQFNKEPNKGILDKTKAV